MTDLLALRDAWSLAAARPVRDGLRAVALRTTPPSVRATIDQSARKGILIRLGPGQVVGGPLSGAAEAPSALHISVFPFTEDGKPVRGLLLTCVDSGLDDVFAAFCVELIERSGGVPISQALEACLYEFRRLLEGSPLPPASAIGLLGELIALDELLDLDATADRLWAWPDLERHDFRNGIVAHEVKTTRRSREAAPVVSITSIDQLAPPDDGQLFLRLIRLERDPAGLVSAQVLCDAIGEKLGPRRDLFRSRVGDAIGQIRHQTFTIMEHRVFDVAAGFPSLTVAALTAARLATGVSNVRYDLDLAVAAPFERDRHLANRALTSGTMI